MQRTEDQNRRLQTGVFQVKRPVRAEPRIKLFLSTGEIEGVFGDGKWTLLDAVRKSGSISTAARELGRSYRKAWGDIHRAEEGLSFPLVETRRGGRSGGQATVTGECVLLLEAWDRYRHEVEAAMVKAFNRHLRPCIERDAGSNGQKSGGA
jgi:molybdate transport system regulatory protein